MTTPVHVLGLAGSLRQRSYNRAAIMAAAAGLPEPVQELGRRIAAADALLIVTPEYNYSMPGVPKNAIDWAGPPTSRSTASRSPSWAPPPAASALRAPSAISARRASS